jgi:hypothetical protein
MIVEWFMTLLDCTGFQTRGQCGPWSESLVRIDIVSNGLITLAYLIIAAGLYTIWTKRRRDIDYGWLLFLLATFSAACGATHACDIVAFWWPGYRLFTVLSAATAILSLSAVLCFARATRILAEIPNPSLVERITRELKHAIGLKEKAINESRGTIAALKRQVDHLERMRKTGLWVAEQESALRELKTVLDSSTVKEVPP